MHNGINLEKKESFTIQCALVSVVRSTPWNTFWFLFVLLLSGCNDEERNAGFQVVPIRNNGPGDRAQSYVAFIPPTQKELFPVLLFLHGHGEKGSDGLFQISNNFGQSVWRRRNQFPFLVVCPQCPTGYEWEATGPNGTHAIESLNDAIRKFRGDPQRIFIAGVSSGAGGAMEIYSSNPDRFAGILLCSSGVGGESALVPTTALPIRNLVNKYDRPGLLSETESSKLKWIKGGHSPSVSVIEGSSTLPHNAWDESYDSPVNFAWMLSSAQLGRSDAPANFQLLSSEQILKTWNHSSANQWNSADSNELCSEPSEEQSYLRSPFFNGDAEIHFEVFLKSTSSVQLQVRCDQPDAIPNFGEAIELVLELPDSGTGGVLNDNGDWIAPLEPAAQRALLEGWNEIRIKKRSNMLTVELCLWPTIQIQGLKISSGIQWAFLNGSSATRVRNVRIYSLEQKKPSVESTQQKSKAVIDP